MDPEHCKINIHYNKSNTPKERNFESLNDSKYSILLFALRKHSCLWPEYPNNNVHWRSVAQLIHSAPLFCANYKVTLSLSTKS